MCSIQFLSKKKYLYIITSQNMQFTNCMFVCKNKLLILQKWEKCSMNQYLCINLFWFYLGHGVFTESFSRRIRQYVSTKENLLKELKQYNVRKSTQRAIEGVFCFTTFTQIFHAIHMFFQTSDRKASGKKSFQFSHSVSVV